MSVLRSRFSRFVSVDAENSALRKSNKVVTWQSECHEKVVFTSENDLSESAGRAKPIVVNDREIVRFPRCYKADENDEKQENEREEL